MDYTKTNNVQFIHEISVITFEKRFVTDSEVEICVCVCYAVASACQGKITFKTMVDSSNSIVLM